MFSLDLSKLNPFIAVGYNRSGGLSYLKNMYSNCIFLPGINHEFTWVTISMDPNHILTFEDLCRFLSVLAVDKVTRSSIKLLSTKVYFFSELKGKLAKQTFKFNRLAVSKLLCAYFELRKKQFDSLDHCKIL